LSIINYQLSIKIMPPKRTSGLREVRVGLLVIISLVVLILLILNASGDFSPFSEKLHVRARFANADGLRPGAEVRLAGVRVGQVEDVRFVPPSEIPADASGGGQVEALLAIDSTIDGRPAGERIRRDSAAQLGSPSLLGTDKLINITPGSAVSEPIREGDLLERSTTADTFSDLTTSGNELTQRLNRLATRLDEIFERVNRGEGTVGRLFTDEALYNSLNATILETQAIAREVRAGRGSAGRFVNDPALYDNLNNTTLQLQAIANDLRAGRGTAGRLLTDEALYNDARSTIARLDSSVNEINGIIAEVRAGRGTLGRLLTDETLYNDTRIAVARFNTTAERIDSVVAGAQRGEGTVGRLLNDETLYNNVNDLSAEGVRLIYDFRQNPRRYLTVKFELF
jgi:phospholipid/cholesterol/gamma-HCH transport system substrate-binding protein